MESLRIKKEVVKPFLFRPARHGTARHARRSCPRHAHAPARPSPAAVAAQARVASFHPLTLREKLALVTGIDRLW
jgi:hypothetical protein